MDDGFEKGQSDNLPKIDGLMVAYYLTKNSDFVAAEMRGVKMQRSVRDNYGDDAIGYVQVKRVGNICTVKCGITPEHRVRATPYYCSLECDEKDNEILNVMCKDCAASSGGCKHAAVAFLIWLHRRSEEPSTTAIKCYWRKSKLSGIGTTFNMIKAKDFSSTTHNEVEQDKETAAIKGGKILEKDVISVVSQIKGLKIMGSGIFLNSDWPMIGASPDGLTDDFVVEVVVFVHFGTTHDFLACRSDIFTL
ncbi:hypothetical protein ACJJTC_000950 [Scirpophaga incertulas]